MLLWKTTLAMTAGHATRPGNYLLSTVWTKFMLRVSASSRISTSWMTVCAKFSRMLQNLKLQRTKRAMCYTSLNALRRERNLTKFWVCLNWKPLSTDCLEKWGRSWGGTMLRTWRVNRNLVRRVSRSSFERLRSFLMSMSCHAHLSITLSCLKVHLISLTATTKLMLNYYIKNMLLFLNTCLPISLSKIRIPRLQIKVHSL